MKRLSDHLARCLATLLIVLMIAMVLDVTWQVISRFIVRAPSSFTEELAGFLLIWISLLGASYALHTRAHLGIDLLTGKLGAPLRRIVLTLAWGSVIVFALAVMVGGGLNYVILAFRLEQISAAMGLPMGYVYLALPLAGLLMAIFAASHLLEDRQDRPGEAGEPRETGRNGPAEAERDGPAEAERDGPAGFRSPSGERT